MRKAAAVAAALLAGSTTCARAPAPRVPQATTAPAQAESPITEAAPVAAVEPLPPAEPHLVPDFARDVQPVLARRCDPCHAPGGKMYERLPFDDPATVASHPEGILKRLKGEDRATVERWIAVRSEPR